MTPREAGAIDLVEPDWRQRFAEHCARFEPHLADLAFQITLADWRKLHATLLPNGKRKPADAVDAVIALAALGVMPPRSLVADVPRGGLLHQEQHDDHCWIISFSEGRAWRITGIEDGILSLDSFGETKTLELTPSQWARHHTAAMQWMKAAYPHLSTAAI
jgi:hypothetical protein